MLGTFCTYCGVWKNKSHKLGACVLDRISSYTYVMCPEATLAPYLDAHAPGT